MSTTDKKRDRALRLKKLREREIAPAQLQQVNGGNGHGSLAGSRYCSP